MILELVPNGVAVAEQRGEIEADLYEEEATAIRSAWPVRRREYVTGRTCARRAMIQLGLPSSPVPQGEAGEPLWPEGVTGSITHCADFRAAAVGMASQFSSIGIDAEPNEPLPDGILERITNPDERQQLGWLPQGEVCWDRLTFSLKETFFKAWFPLTRRRIEQTDAVATINPHDRVFTVQILPSALKPGEPIQFSGRWDCHDDLLISAIVTQPGLS